MYLLNAFSLNMLDGSAVVGVVRLSAQEAAIMLASGFKSAVGHADTAEVMSSILGLPVETNRETVSLRFGDSAVIGQYSGPRLPEGAKTLPEGAEIRWFYVEIAE